MIEESRKEQGRKGKFDIEGREMKEKDKAVQERKEKERREKKKAGNGRKAERGVG